MYIVQKTLHTSCQICKNTMPSFKLIPVWKEVVEFETSLFGGYVCNNWKCMNKLSYPWRTE